MFAICLREVYNKDTKRKGAQKMEQTIKDKKMRALARLTVKISKANCIDPETAYFILDLMLDKEMKIEFNSLGIYADRIIETAEAMLAVEDYNGIKRPSKKKQLKVTAIQSEACKIIYAKEMED
jgi:hypothetical protein